MDPQVCMEVEETLKSQHYSTHRTMLDPPQFLTSKYIIIHRGEKTQHGAGTEADRLKTDGIGYRAQKQTQSTTPTYSLTKMSAYMFVKGQPHRQMITGKLDAHM